MRKMFFALAAGLALFGGTSAWAQSLDFSVPAINPGASISYAGGNADLIATGISVSNVTGKGTPLNNLVTLLFSPAGTLNFQSGPYTSVGSSSSVWNFGGTGPISIAGTIPAQGTFGGDTPGPQLSGTILSASVQNVAGVFNLSVAVFINTIDSALASYYGVGTGGWTGALHIDFSPATTNTDPATGTAFSSTSVGSGDVVTSVPEPSTMAIAGLGAIGFIGFGLRRRLKK